MSKLVDSLSDSFNESKKVIARIFKVHRTDVCNELKGLNTRLTNIELPASTSQANVLPPAAQKKPRKGNHVCTICGRTLSRSDALARHMKQKHLNQRVRKEGKHRSHKRFVCYLCDEKFSRKESLPRHMQRFHLPKGEPKKQRCLCGKFFNSMDSLRKHEKNCPFHKQSTSKQ